MPVLLPVISLCFFFFNDTATTEIYTLSLHDALPISGAGWQRADSVTVAPGPRWGAAVAFDTDLDRIVIAEGTYDPCDYYDQSYADSWTMASADPLLPA